MSLLKDKLKENFKEYPIIVCDDRGNKIYVEYNNYYHIYRYDDNNKVVYYEDNFGYSEITRYDCRGNKIYFETSEGFWCKMEYDIDNNEIYYEDSYGNIEEPIPKKEFTIQDIENRLGIKNIKIIK